MAPTYEVDDEQRTFRWAIVGVVVLGLGFFGSATTCALDSSKAHANAEAVEKAASKEIERIVREHYATREEPKK